jgi:hypothetical protein
MAKALPSLPAPASSGNVGATGAMEYAMKLRCKSGDLALVIHDEDICQQNIGKLVRVAGPLDYNRRLKRVCWLIEPVKAEPWQCVTPKVQHYQRIVTFANNMEHPDSWLLPIDPETWSFGDDVEGKTHETA